MGFLQEPWLAEIDFSTLEKVNGSYVSDDLRSREDDVIWRVRFKGRWWLHILVEFQSSVDACMALRIMDLARPALPRHPSPRAAARRPEAAAGAAHRAARPPTALERHPRHRPNDRHAAGHKPRRAARHSCAAR